jgi:hypothetical protein
LEVLFGLPFHMRMLFPAAEGGRFCESWFCRAFVFPDNVPGRVGVSPFVFIVWTGMCDAPAPGVVRAMTERFSTAEGGRETLPLALTAPNALCLVGDTPRLLVTFALRSVDSFK